jgi:aspartate aminotransferase
VEPLLYLAAMSHFASLSETPPDAAFALIDAYKADHSPLKVDLSPGFYRDEDARPWILPSVRKVTYITNALV